MVEQATDNLKHEVWKSRFTGNGYTSLSRVYAGTKGEGDQRNSF